MASLLRNSLRNSLNGKSWFRNSWNGSSPSEDFDDADLVKGLNGEKAIPLAPLEQEEEDERSVASLSVPMRRQVCSFERPKSEWFASAPPVLRVNSQEYSSADHVTTSDEEEDDDDDDTASTIRPMYGSQRTLTLSIASGFDERHWCDDNSTIGRLTKMFHDDIESVVEGILERPDDEDKIRLIREVLRELKNLQTAVNINSHFVILSSLVGDDPVEKEQEEEGAFK